MESVDFDGLDEGGVLLIFVVGDHEVAGKTEV